MIGTDTTTRAIAGAMDGLELRTQVAADNIANAEVPGFTARTVSFESQLRDALARGDGLSRPVVAASREPAGPGGNNVAVEDELIELIETNLARTAMVQSFNYKTGLLRTALRGGA